MVQFAALTQRWSDARGVGAVEAGQLQDELIVRKGLPAGDGEHDRREIGKGISSGLDKSKPIRLSCRVCKAVISSGRPSYSRRIMQRL